jgi:hypothetical protein
MTRLVLATTTASTVPVHGVLDASQLTASMADLDVRAITEDVWRVRDSRLPDDDALCVLGVIEKKTDGSFEALKVGQGFIRSSYDSFDAAVASFATR